jgi:hypothetical protein
MSLAPRCSCGMSVEQKEMQFNMIIMTDRYATTCVDFYYKYHMFSREFPQVLGNLIDKGEITC